MGIYCHYSLTGWNRVAAIQTSAYSRIYIVWFFTYTASCRTSGEGRRSPLVNDSKTSHSSWRETNCTRLSWRQPEPVKGHCRNIWFSLGDQSTTSGNPTTDITSAHETLGELQRFGFCLFFRELQVIKITSKVVPTSPPPVVINDTRPTWDKRRPL